MLQTIPKSKFKPKVLEYLRGVEEKKKPLIITHSGKPVVKIIPFEEVKEEKLLKELGDAIVAYGNLVDPVGEDDWEALK
jgi:prevent-host-death family protein